MKVYSRNWKEGIAILVTFTIQYCFYPGVMLLFEPTFFTSFTWFVISVVTFHSLFDTVGRYLAGKIDLVGKNNFFLVCLSRLVFVALYLLQYQGGVWGSDWFIIVNLFLFSLSCGYLSTLGMNYGSDSSTVDQSMAGSIMGFHLTFGISLGSAIALICLSK